MKPNVATYVALNRRLRGLYAQALALASGDAEAADVKTKGAALRRQVDAIRKRTQIANSLYRNRIQFVQAFALDDEAGAAFMQVSTMTPAALRGFVPHVINAFNAGHPNARGFAAAIVNQLDGMDEKTRPMPSARFVSLLDLPDFDVLSVNSKESFALAETLTLVAGQLAASGTLTADTKMKIGLGLKELRPADQLTTEDEAVFKIEEEQPDAPDPAEPAAGDNPGQAGAGDAVEEPDGGDEAGAADAHGEDRGGAQGSGEAQGVGDLV